LRHHIQYLEERSFSLFSGRFLKTSVVTLTALARFRQKQKEKETDPSETIQTIQTIHDDDSKNAFRSSPFAKV